VKHRKPTKRALLVGINKYKPELNADLRGCVNDVENMRGLLITKFGFEPENIRVLIDDRATRQAIIKRLQWIIKKSRKGDELVFHYSGHGSQVRDRNGDELKDGLDEILCPHDLDWNNPLTDDILARLFKKLRKGAYLTMICDSCHSGTMTRSVRIGNPHGEADRFILPPFDIRARSMGVDLPKHNIGRKQRIGRIERIERVDVGQRTWALTSVIRDNPSFTWRQAHAGAAKLLELRRYTQQPQISGNDNLIIRKVFGNK